MLVLRTGESRFAAVGNLAPGGTHSNTPGSGLPAPWQAAQPDRLVTGRQAMPVIIVGTEKNFAALRLAPVQRQGLEREACSEVTDAVAAANPHADLERSSPARSSRSRTRRTSPSAATSRSTTRRRS